MAIIYGNSNSTLFLPRPKTEYLKKSISFRGPKIWNFLSKQARNSESLSIFNANISNASLFDNNISL